MTLLTNVLVILGSFPRLLQAYRAMGEARQRNRSGPNGDGQSQSGRLGPVTGEMDKQCQLGRWREKLKKTQTVNNVS